MSGVSCLRRSDFHLTPGAAAMGSARGAACPPCLSCPTGSGPADNKVQNTKDVNGFTGRITTAIGSVPTDWELQVDGAGGLCARLCASLPDFVLPCWESHRGQLVRLHGTCARAGQAARAPRAAVERRCCRSAGAESCLSPSGGTVPH